MTGSLSDALFAVHAVLEYAGVPHALCGGLAANLYRDEVRATADVDLAVAAGPSRLVDLVRTFTDAGWSAEPYWRQGEQVRLTRRDLPRVDLILATTDFERAAIERAAPAAIEGRTIPVLVAEDLVVQKLLAGRARDYEAVAAMINAMGDRLDSEYIRGWLEQFDAGEAWARAIDEARREAEG
jgi:predicted nucleotidyltransferase